MPLKGGSQPAQSGRAKQTQMFFIINSDLGQPARQLPIVRPLHCLFGATCKTGTAVI